MPILYSNIIKSTELATPDSCSGLTTGANHVIVGAEVSVRKKWAAPTFRFISS